MNVIAEARAAVRAHMAGQPTAYTGSFEAVHQIMFGPLRFDQHVKAWRNHLWITERRAAYRRADAGVREYLATQGVTV